MGCIITEQEISKIHSQNINLCDKYVPSNTSFTKENSKSKESSFSRHFLGFGGKFVLEKELKNSGNPKKEALKNNYDSVSGKSPAIVKSRVAVSNSPSKADQIIEASFPSVSETSPKKLFSPQKSPRSSNIFVFHSPKANNNNLEDQIDVKQITPTTPLNNVENEQILLIADGAESGEIIKLEGKFIYKYSRNSNRGACK